MDAVWVALADIRISERGRRNISASTVERYRRWLDQGREAPPVRLRRDGDGFLVQDGRHRVAAAVAAGHAFIEAQLDRIRRSASRRLLPLRRILGMKLWR